MSLTPVIMDCDPGHDDAIAILYAARHLDVRAITTVFGNASVEDTTRNALRICDLGGLDVPVASGCAQALRGDFVASPVHGQSGLDGADYLPASQRAPSSRHAVDMIIETAAAAPGEVSLIATGPLTNVALALRREPRLAGWLRAISIMGGSTDIGNETPFAEANIFRDPEAADIVLRCGAHITMVGLNVTRQARIGCHTIKALEGGGAVADAVADMLRFYLGQYEKRYGIFEAPMHDPTAVLALVRPELITFRPLNVDVELGSVLLRGMTVCDMRGLLPQGRPVSQGRVLVGTAVDGEAAVSEVFAAIRAYGTH